MTIEPKIKCPVCGDDIPVHTEAKGMAVNISFGEHGCFKVFEPIRCSDEIRTELETQAIIRSYKPDEN